MEEVYSSRSASDGKVFTKILLRAITLNYAIPSKVNLQWITLTNYYILANKKEKEKEKVSRALG